MAIKTKIYNFKGIEVKEAVIQVKNFFGNSNGLNSVIAILVENKKDDNIIFEELETFNFMTPYVSGESSYTTLYNALGLKYGGEHFTMPDSYKIPDEEKLAYLKDKKIREINSNCEAMITGGFPSDALGKTHYYKSDRDEQLNLVGRVASGLECSIEVSNDGVSYVATKHTNKQAKQVLQDGATLKEKVLATCKEMKQVINNCTTLEEINAL